MSANSSAAAALTAALVRAPTITPDSGPALDILEQRFALCGFEATRLVFSSPGTPDVENLFAAIGTGSRHLTFAGHVDVVPPGDETRWHHPPFGAEIHDGLLYGRGAVDMKSGVAAMIVAAERFIARRGKEFGGRISFLITGDEEGPAINGTAKLLEWAAAGGERFTAAIVGEPASNNRVGDQIRIGRRGSWSATVTVAGVQGHAAYPENADNPVRGLVTLLGAIMAPPLDRGSERFAPSTLEVVSADVGNSAWNVIPGAATARINSRYNDLWTVDTLEAEIRRRLTAAAGDRKLRPEAEAQVSWRLDAEPPVSKVFVTRDKALIDTISSAMETVTGLTPAQSTGGGTSDARFINAYCPVVEVGLVGKTMHEVDECVRLDDIDSAVRIYEAVLDAYFTD